MNAATTTRPVSRSHVARLACGCLVAACYADYDGAAREMRKWKAAGYRVETIPSAEVKTENWQGCNDNPCPLCRRPKAAQEAMEL